MTCRNLAEMDKIPGNKLSFYEFCFEWINISGTFEKSVLEKNPWNLYKNKVIKLLCGIIHYPPYFQKLGVHPPFWSILPLTASHQASQLFKKKTVAKKGRTKTHFGTVFFFSFFLMAKACSFRCFFQVPKRWIPWARSVSPSLSRKNIHRRVVQ